MSRKMYPLLKFEYDFLIFDSRSDWMPIDGPAYVISLPFHFTNEQRLEILDRIDGVLKQYYDHIPFEDNKEFLRAKKFSEISS